jgi:NitT/TauT family transport system substrate-binding protein
MDWMRSHTAEEVRTQMSESLRQPDATADLDAIRTAQRTLSADGRMPSEGPELVRKVLAATNAKARSATLDLTRTYNNEFIPHP